MKSPSHLRAAAIFAAVFGSLAASAHAVTMTANFDAITAQQRLGTTYQEGGLTFGSPTALEAISLQQAGTEFGWSPLAYLGGNALSVHNQGWLSVSAGGQLLDSVSFLYGFDWNGYMIENGLMDTTFSWEALAGGQLVGAGQQTWDAQHRTHGNLQLLVNPDAGFDTLLIRSTAVAYQGISHDGLHLDRDAVMVGYGDINTIAIDNVTAVTLSQLGRSLQVAGVPDGGAAIVLLLGSLAALAGARRFVQPTSTIQ